MRQNEQISEFGMFTLDQNGRVIFLLGGFPGSSVARETGNVLPVEDKK